MIKAGELGTLGQQALSRALRVLPEGAALTTGAMLAALVEADQSCDWPRIWLHTGEPEALRLAAADDGNGVRERWEGVLISGAMARAWEVLDRICTAYEFESAPSGAIMLALIADPSSGAARALLGSGIGQARLLDLVQTEIVGMTLTDLHECPDGTASTAERGLDTVDALWAAAEYRA